jgi:hypothetical protein
MIIRKELAYNYDEIRTEYLLRGLHAINDILFNGNLPLLKCKGRRMEKFFVDFS